MTLNLAKGLFIFTLLMFLTYNLKGSEEERIEIENKSECQTVKIFLTGGSEEQRNMVTYINWQALKPTEKATVAARIILPLFFKVHDIGTNKTIYVAPDENVYEGFGVVEKLKERFLIAPGSYKFLLTDDYSGSDYNFADGTFSPPRYVRIMRPNGINV